MITADDTLFLFLQYGRGKPSAIPAGRPVFRQQVAGGRNMWVNTNSRKRTKAEARKRLEKATIPIRIITPFVPPQVRPIFVGTPRLADFFIETDPLDRLED